MRVALVTNLCTHYRRPLFEELGRRFDLSLFLTSDASEWYWPSANDVRPRGLPGVVDHPRRRLVRTLARGRYDCIVAGLTGRTIVPKVFLAARTNRLPFVLWAGLWEHPATPFHRLSRPLTRRLYRAADALLVYGSHVADHVAAESGRTERVFVAPQAVDNDLFRQPVSDDQLAPLHRELSLNDVPVVMYVGRLEPEKGLETLLRASAAATRRHTLVLVGSGSLEPELRDRAARLTPAVDVRFAGRVEQADLPAYLGLANALVLPSVTTTTFKEPWGLVVNEAMNCGVPVLATDAVGAAAGGLVVDGETGVVVPERDAAALASALDLLLGDPALRERLGAAAAERVLELSFEASADAFERAVEAATLHRQSARRKGVPCVS